MRWGALGASIGGPLDPGIMRTLERVLPRVLVPLFTESFVRSCLLYDEFTFRLSLQVFREAGLAEAARVPGSVEEIAARAGCEPGRALVPLRWLLQELLSRGAAEVLPAPGQTPRPSSDEGAIERCAERGKLSPRWEGSGFPAELHETTRSVESPLRDAFGGQEGVRLEALAAGDTPRFRTVLPFPCLDPAELLEAQRGLDPSWLPSYAVAQTAAGDYPAFLRGEVSGEEILFSPARLGLWFDYFTNDNGLYAVNNRVGAIAAASWLGRGGDLSVLEIGGGLASAALALLERFRDEGRLGEIASYRFTELIPAFLRRGQRALTACYGASGVLSFGRLDMDKPFAAQGVEESSRTFVYAVNALHVARDLAFTLAEIRRSLKPGGTLVLSECVRPYSGHPVYVEFIFNLMESFRAPQLDPRFRPNGGFLTPEQWTAALEAAGFSAVRFFPDLPRLREHVPVFFVAAIGARRSAEDGEPSESRLR